MGMFVGSICGIIRGVGVAMKVMYDRGGERVKEGKRFVGYVCVSQKGFWVEDFDTCNPFVRLYEFKKDAVFWAGGDKVVKVVIEEVRR